MIRARARFVVRVGFTLLVFIAMQWAPEAVFPFTADSSEGLRANSRETKRPLDSSGLPVSSAANWSVKMAQSLDLPKLEGEDGDDSETKIRLDLEPLGAVSTGQLRSLKRAMMSAAVKYAKDGMQDPRRYDASYKKYHKAADRYYSDDGIGGRRLQSWLRGQSIYRGEFHKPYHGLKKEDLEQAKTDDSP
ncbi:hypothetical protein ACFL2Q_09650 [Thermodesulfobacteriota bacterium]